MKNLISIAVLLCFVVVPFARGGGEAGKPEKVTWYSFDEGLREAKKQNKKIYVDVYTDWCGWCKKMDKEVFTHAKVAPYMAEQYIAIRMNGESAAKVTYKEKTSSEMQLAQAFGVTGFPTALFMEPNGDLLTTLPGYVKADDFIAVLRYFGDGHYKTSDWRNYYDQYLKDNAPAPQK